VAALSEMMIISTAASRTVISTPGARCCNTPEPRHECTSSYVVRSSSRSFPSRTASYSPTRIGTLISDAVGITSPSSMPKCSPLRRGIEHVLLPLPFDVQNDLHPPAYADVARSAHPMQVVSLERSRRCGRQVGRRLAAVLRQLDQPAVFTAVMRVGDDLLRRLD